MDAIRRIGQPTFERTGGGRDERVSVRFKLNREPDMTWMDCFKSHAASSALGGANAVFRGNEVCIEVAKPTRSEEHTSELQSRPHLVCRLLLEKKKKNTAH